MLRSVAPVGSWAAGPPAGGIQCRQIGVEISPRSQQRTDVEFRLSEAGHVTLLFGGREQLLPARRLAVFWSGIPHQVVAHEARRVWSLRVPLRWVLARQLPVAFVDGMLGGRIYFEPDFDHYPCDLFRLQLWSRDTVSDTAFLRRAAELELEARLTRLVATLPEAPSGTADEPPPFPAAASKALELAGAMASRYADSLSLTELAQNAGLHRNYAMNLFRRELGGTLLEYLTQLRLAQGMRLLITTRLALKEVARRSGFGSLKRFTVTFRQAFKDTPAAFRRTHSHSSTGR